MFYWNPQKKNWISFIPNEIKIIKIIVLKKRKKNHEKKREKY